MRIRGMGMQVVIMADADARTPAWPSELMIWLSPSFPTGAFAYSQGLETAVTKGVVCDVHTLGDWLAASLSHGALGNDLKLISLAMRAETAAARAEVAALADAMQTTRERRDEARALGSSFRDAVVAGWPATSAAFRDCADGQPMTYPVAVACAARARTLPIAATLDAYAHSGVSNALSAAIRLSVVGQFAAQRIHAARMADAAGAVAIAESCCVADLGTTTFMADIFSMQHETQSPRLFRS